MLNSESNNIILLYFNWMASNLTTCTICLQACCQGVDDWWIELIVLLMNSLVSLLFIDCQFLWVLLLLNSFTKSNTFCFNKIKIMTTIWIDTAIYILTKILCIPMKLLVLQSPRKCQHIVMKPQCYNNTAYMYSLD